MINLREKYFKIEKLAETDLEKSLQKMIALFPEVSNSFEHDIYHSIIQWIGIKGNVKTIEYIDSLNFELYDEDCLEILYELKSKIEKRLTN